MNPPVFVRIENINEDYAYFYHVREEVRMYNTIPSLPDRDRFTSKPIFSGMLLILLVGAGQVSGVDHIKQNNSTALNLAGSWDALPGSGDVAVWDGTVTSANSSALGGASSWQGVRIASPGGLVTIGTTAAMS